MHPKAILIKWLKILGAGTRQAIIGYIAVALILAAGGLLSISKTALTFFLQIANIPTPLWATTLLILLCGLYMYLRGNEYFQKKRPYNLQEDLIPVGKFKWKTLHAEGQVIEIGGLPYCIEHECSFVSSDSNWGCPITGCKSILSQYDLDKVQVAASSIIEALIRNKKC